MTALRPLTMKISLDAFKHLGINLYSNVPAVLSEIVANAWDADASRVEVALLDGGNGIEIEDDGAGMTRDQVVERFLLVGYQRRNKQPGNTPKGRSPMGRKGIGKLSLFSIADDIVVETVSGDEKTAWRMCRDAIEAAISNDWSEYHPEELEPSDKHPAKGTRIVLSKLRKRRTIGTAAALRKRLARRFSIIGPSDGFEVTVDGHRVAPEDRGYFDRLQYIWTYGDQSDVLNRCSADIRIEQRDCTVSMDTGDDIAVKGWLGTVCKSGQLKDDLGENLNRIAIFVRGKMAQEDLLADYAERGVYASYLIGELEVDGMDTARDAADQDEDSATTSRQRLLEDDPRYVALRSFVASELKHIQKQWTDLRTDDGAKRARSIPAIRKWLNSLPNGNRHDAERWIGRTNRLGLDDAQRTELMKQAILAYEFYRCNQNLRALDRIDDTGMEAVLPVLREMDSLELALYGQIVRQRVGVIRALKKRVDENEKEKSIQQVIFDHLWLLDPSWERAAASEIMETRVGNLFQEIDAGLTQEEKLARLDIKYRETSGKHVIVELKRPDRTVSVYDLARQIGKYRSGMLKILQTINRTYEPVEFVCLLGAAPREHTGLDGARVVEQTLGAQNARFVTYDQLLDRTFRAYSDFLQKGEDVDWLSALIKEIDGDPQQ